MPVQDTKENADRCVCRQCPSFNECMKEKEEVLFCARGKAVCAFEKKGCICMGCPVTKDNGIHGGYYCESGAAK